MTASEMFEELGYKRNVEREKIIYLFKYEFGYYYYQVTFDLSEKIIDIDNNFETNAIEDDLLKAIDKQAEELGWLYEKTCTNESEYDSSDEFKCSNCGFMMAEHKELEIDEDDGEKFYYNYKPKYCPNCGRKIVN